jgi:acyl dehydratase
MPQLFFEEIAEKMELSVHRKETSSRFSAQWAAASGDFDPIHYDQAYALAQKLPGAIINGRLKMALFSRMLTDFMGPAGRLKRLAARHQGMDLVGQPLTLKARITRKYTAPGENLVDCEIWMEDGQRKQTAIGSATFSLPSQKK